MMTPPSENDRSSPIQESEQVTRTARGMPPTDFMLKIQNFSVVSKAMENYQSSCFEASGYKWRLCIYFNGNKRASEGRTGGEGESSYVSVYLVLAEPDVLENGSAIDVDFKFFVYDQIQKNFVVFENANVQTKKFHKLKRAQGILNLMPTDEFCNAASTSQYLVNDSCIFGVELFVIKNMTRKAVCLSNVHMPKEDHCLMRAHIWKFDNFSKRKNKVYYSNSFMAGERKWRLLVRPRWDKKCLALGVELADTSSLFGFDKWLHQRSYYRQKLYAMFILVVHDQFGGSAVNTNFAKACWGVFSGRTTCKVNKNFMDLTELRDPSKGFLVNDALIIGAEIHHIYFDRDI